MTQTGTTCTSTYILYVFCSYF